MWGPRNHILGGDPDPLMGRGTVLGVMLGYAQTCQQSIFPAVFARGQQQCGLWQPVFYSNLLLLLAKIKCKKVRIT